MSVDGGGTVEAQEDETAGWWGVADSEILQCLAENGTITPGELATEFGISESEATALLARLARAGKVHICQVELAG